MAGYQKGPRDSAIGLARMHAHDAHGGRWREIVGVDEFEQALGKSGELGIHLQLDTARQQCKAFQQPLDEGVGHLHPLYSQASGDLGMLLRELLPQLAHIGQLAVVVIQQAGIHQLSPN
ncbi:hypothetical protein D3C72_1890200 [compost metagenome]